MTTLCDQFRGNPIFLNVHPSCKTACSYQQFIVEVGGGGYSYGSERAALLFLNLNFRITERAIYNAIHSIRESEQLFVSY